MGKCYVRIYIFFFSFLFLFVRNYCSVCWVWLIRKPQVSRRELLSCTKSGFTTFANEEDRWYLNSFSLTLKQCVYNTTFCYVIINLWENLYQSSVFKLETFVDIYFFFLLTYINLLNRRNVVLPVLTLHDGFR